MGLRESRRLTSFTGLKADAGLPSRGEVQGAREVQIEWHDRAFREEIGKYREEIGDRMGLLIGNLANDLLARVTQRTPVDTGTAKNGWAIVDKDYSGPDPYAVVANRVFYVIFLEFGWSDQAPNGMLRISLREMKHRVRRNMKAVLESI